MSNGHFSKIAETAHRAISTEAAYSEHSIAIHSISMAGYVNAVPAFVCFELPAREASSFYDFRKLTSCDFIAFIQISQTMDNGMYLPLSWAHNSITYFTQYQLTHVQSQ